MNAHGDADRIRRRSLRAASYTYQPEVVFVGANGEAVMPWQLFVCPFGVLLEEVRDGFDGAW